VVTKSLPPESVCAGNPAKVICGLDEYLEKHRGRLGRSPTFSVEDYVSNPTPGRIAELTASVRAGDAYVVGGRSAELAGKGGTPRTK
jgi:maltose O-acetyltransferase